jgi:superfamily I DNA/RNA helicase
VKAGKRDVGAWSSTAKGDAKPAFEEIALAPALEADEGTKAVPHVTLHKSKELEHHTVIFVDLGDLAWRSYVQNTAEATVGFFVAFTRAKQRVFFTNSPSRNTRRSIAPLYTLLASADVQILAVA